MHQEAIRWQYECNPPSKPQRALHHQTPIATMKEWQEKRPDLFYKNVINHAGPDI